MKLITHREHDKENEVLIPPRNFNFLAKVFFTYFPCLTNSRILQELMAHELQFHLCHAACV